MYKHQDIASEATSDELRASWNKLITQLEEARNAIDDPALYPAPGTTRNLAEGYRYVLGFLYGTLARSLGPTNEFPYFVRAIQPLNRSTIDNADAIYLSAPIDGNFNYTIKGRVGDARHWRGEQAIAKGRKAPHYVIFETPSGYSGDTGSIKEMRPGTRANCDVLDSTKIQVAADGTFEIHLGPERPDGFSGNFMLTRTTRTQTDKAGNTTSRTYVAERVMLRELFCDWENEDLMDLFIYRDDRLGHPMPTYTPEMAAQQMEEIGRLTRNQVYFWNEFYAITCEAYGDMNGDGKCFMPRNDLNKPNAASLATAGGMATNIYTGGIYELDADEAVIVELHQPIEPNYIGFALSNMWGESLDFANYQSSLNGVQAHRDPDNVIRYVIAHRDPGVANWVDTTGHPEGFIGVRWAYSERPTDNLPWGDLKKVKLSELMAHLPKSTKLVTPEERRAAIAIRQEHVQRRYRQH